MPALGLLLLASLSMPRTARAQSGNFWETIGISIAVGTVLGASTLPFYSQPGKHAKNLAYGAGAGVVAGLGVLVYELARGHSSDDWNGAFNERRDNPRSLSGDVPIRPAAAAWMPLVSVNW